MDRRFLVGLSACFMFAAVVAVAGIFNVSNYEEALSSSLYDGVFVSKVREGVSDRTFSVDEINWLGGNPQERVDMGSIATYETFYVAEVLRDIPEFLREFYEMTNPQIWGNGKSSGLVII
ncbi:MAG: 3'-5' exoribonuclease [Turicibacter sp.]|nr:3'-5' exoribonuclease [Turicibacter sp.]